MSDDTASPARQSLRFEYWSDPLCIWAYVAQSKLERVIAEWGEHLTIAYRIVPVFGSFPRRFSTGAWAEGGHEGRREATARVAGTHGCEGVTGELWTRDTPTSSWSCGAAAKAVFHMESLGESAAGSGAGYLRALRRRAFEANENVCRRAVQLSVAEECGVGPQRLAEWLDDGLPFALLAEDDEDRKALGVRGSPSYVFDGGRATLYGNFPFEVLHATMQELLRGLGVGVSAC
ncbi:MAG: DsbA family protein [Sandaracinaceae bacterium]|nr:DsbA family protein [Myxococcales bacterium]MCB9660952.1 DsbA family protein [Sandaracinaceae bacterium]